MERSLRILFKDTIVYLGPQFFQTKIGRSKFRLRVIGGLEEINSEIPPNGYGSCAVIKINSEISDDECPST